MTLAGQSAGGQSTALHYVTSDMQSYFKQFIVQSAPMTIPFKLVILVLYISNKIIRILEPMRNMSHLELCLPNNCIVNTMI